ncbi:hypothetical protein B0H66DRAFT_473455 [Apodospora peruviana]|uniref:PHD-type domain-containing protein n=1 Tax=Apodospora peruviana TaxID=516989 RepID=A0AAE0ICD6_9PEZI|nr:hypothetical protein B0H66DRAFT_473455 [Apodospora peruviana]
MISPDVARPDNDEAVSPRQNVPTIQRAVRSLGTMNGSLNSLDMRADPDAQSTVNDFSDFTEYLPSDMMRSLTLIGKLDQTYFDSSIELDGLTSQWGRRPSVPPAERPRADEVRAQISEKLHHTVSSRVYSHAEAVRMLENLNRHHNRIKTIRSKLETMLENYPAESQIKSPVARAKSPQTTAAHKNTQHMGGARRRRTNIPRITVPGEVLAPYELNFYAGSSEEDISDDEGEEEDDEGSLPTNRVTPAPPSRIKVVKSASRPPKPGKVLKSRTSVPPPNVPGGVSISTSSALAKLQPPPENVVIGSADAPWGQLTPYELAKLRKRMKKNAAWTPSDTMVARELSMVGRGVEAFKAAKKKAEEEGRPFNGKMPVPIIDPETGEERMPLGSLTLETLASDEKNLSNRGMKLNEAKKLKREQLAKQAAEEAEESTRNLRALAQIMMGGTGQQPLMPQEQANKLAASSKVKPPPKKRKRDSVPAAEADKPEVVDGQTQRPQFKRTKTETPVPPPHLTPNASQVAHETPAQPAQRFLAAAVLHSTTPIPLPIHGQDQSITAKSGTSVASTTSPAPSSNAGVSGTTNVTIVPVKLPAAETQIPAPLHSPKKSTTPILPPVRETRKAQAARIQEQQQKDAAVPQAVKVPSRGASPAPLTPKPDPDAVSITSTTAVAHSTTTVARRPASRGKAGSQEPPFSLAADRPRRASTARNTPAPEPTRPSSRRSKRPAPGIISRTVSGGNSAVGKRKAAPKKKSRGSVGKVNKDSKAGADLTAGGGGDGEIEVDDEGKPIDPSEPRYCICNGVSFGTMIQCDNTESCKNEWFHIECVDLSDLPARTTKWYCPDCRVLLNIGEKGEVSARGVRA